MAKVTDHPNLFAITRDNTVLALREAMLKGKTVSFIYDGKPKTVEVHAVGKVTSGKLAMRGYQVAGHASRPLPIWALYHIEKIEGLSTDFVDSQAPRQGYNPKSDAQLPTMLTRL